MVSVAECVYVSAYFCCAGIFDSILFISALYAKAGTGTQAGSMACASGECYRFYGVYLNSVFKASDRFFQKDAFYIFVH